VTGQAPVEFADGSRGGGEHLRSLAAWLGGVSEARAAAVLADPAEFRRVLRARMTPQQRLRELEKRYAVPLP
jgi:hypothetical protein